jgi:hypothetical protein
LGEIIAFLLPCILAGRLDWAGVLIITGDITALGEYFGKTFGGSKSGAFGIIQICEGNMEKSKRPGGPRAFQDATAKFFFQCG